MAGKSKGRKGGRSWPGKVTAFRKALIWLGCAVFLISLLSFPSGPVSRFLLYMVGAGIWLLPLAMIAIGLLYLFRVHYAQRGRWMFSLLTSVILVSLFDASFFVVFYGTSGRGGLLGQGLLNYLAVFGSSAAHVGLLSGGVGLYYVLFKPMLLQIGLNISTRKVLFGFARKGWGSFRSRLKDAKASKGAMPKGEKCGLGDTVRVHATISREFQLGKSV